jgi:uncharacterized membrane protein YdbT with pleckstrin-like domain
MNHEKHDEHPSKYVHVRRSIEPEKPEVSPALKLKHERSVALFPHLNLSEGEFVIRSVERHPIGLFVPIGLGLFLLVLAFFGIFNIDQVLSNNAFSNQPSSFRDAVLLVLVGFALLVSAGIYVAWYVYTKNRFYLTNESVIQELQYSLFFHKEQTVSLQNIEDASYKQEGIIPHIFNYGSIRLSTEGDETTYRFTFVANPKEHIAVLNNAVEAFKNGRPVNDD